MAFGFLLTLRDPIHEADGLEGSQYLDGPEQRPETSRFLGTFTRIEARPPFTPEKFVWFGEILEDITRAIRFGRDDPSLHLIEGQNQFASVGLARPHRDLDPARFLSLWFSHRLFW